MSFPTKKYSCLLFDLDGTLIYSHEGIYHCFRYALSRMGRREPTERELRKCIGPPLERSFADVFAMSEAEAAQATAIYREEYARTGMFENALVEGVNETLSALKGAGYKLAVATSKAEVFAEAIVKRLGIREYFDVFVGSGLDGRFCTKSAVVAEAVKRLGARCANCLMIGDRKQDLDGARENGVDCLILRLGYAERGEFSKEKPDYFLDTFQDLVGLLLM